MSVSVIFQIALELWGSAFSIVAAIVVSKSQGSGRKSDSILTALLSGNALMLLCDSLAYVYRGSLTPLGCFMTRASNLCAFFLQYAMFFGAGMYMDAVLRENGAKLSQRMLRICGICAAIGVSMLLLNHFTHFIYDFDEQNRYFRKNGIYLLFLMYLLGGAVICGTIIRHRRYLRDSQFFAMLSYMLLPVVSTAIQAVFYGFSVINIASTVSMLLIFSAHEAALVKRLDEQRRQLDEQRILLATSQIQPHFLFNSLATISVLCQIDPEMAESAVNHFADYLRMNLDAMGKSRMVSFDQELEHTRTYLWLEQLRFGDELSIQYDIAATDFFLPPLVLQPIVENAVKHGVCKKPEGGCVIIFSRRTAEGVTITVQDNGVGFDPSQKPDDGRRHVGIENVNERLRSLCGGSLTISSKPGEGTTAIISLPNADQ